MNQRQLASVLFATVGVFVAAASFPGIIFSVAALSPLIPANADPAAPADQPLMLVLGLVSALLAALIGLVLVLLRDRLANRLFPPAGAPLSASEVHSVALSVLGCYFVVQGISQLAWAGQLVWSGATQLVLALGLFIGGRNLSRLWMLGRSAGDSRSPNDDAV